MSSDGNLRRIFRSQLVTAHWQSIETGAVGPGTPDSNFCFPGGREGWIEFKFTSGWTVPLRPAQIGWLLRRARAGGRVWVAVRQQRKAEDVLWLAPGSLAAGLRESGLRGNGAIHHWGGGPSSWPWDKIKRLLTD